SDFIFPIIGEELGLRFSLLVVFLFVVIIVCGIMIALHAKDRFGLLLGCGVVSLIGLQAAVNMGVTTSLLPNKGLSLPFIRSDDRTARKGSVWFATGVRCGLVDWVAGCGQHGRDHFALA